MIVPPFPVPEGLNDRSLVRQPPMRVNLRSVS